MVASGLILAAAVLVASPAPKAQPETVPNRYIVEFVDPPAAAFNGLADKRGGWVLEPTNPAVSGEQRLRADSHKVRAYRDYLALRRAETLSAMEARLDRRITPQFIYELILLPARHHSETAGHGRDRLCTWDSREKELE